MSISFKELEQFNQDGYVIKKNLFSGQEVDKLVHAVEAGGRVSESVNTKLDQSGKKAKLAIWHELGHDIWSAASICPRIVNSVRILLGEEISFFHGKVMFKEAHSGGAWEWHQDYGYWYKEGFVFPHMLSAFVALDPATRENGCLKVLKGSHKLERMEHGTVGSQVGADGERIDQIDQYFETVECEMTPGSVLFFDSNLLHSSSANDSDHHRRAFIMCYNALSNPQLKDGHMTYREICPTGNDEGIIQHL